MPPAIGERAEEHQKRACSIHPRDENSRLFRSAGVKLHRTREHQNQRPSMPRRNALPGEKNPRRIAHAEVSRMAHAKREETKEARAKAEQCSDADPGRRHPHAERDAPREQEAGDEEFYIPCPRRTIRSNREPMERIAKHGKPLPDKGRPAIVVVVPQRKLPALKDTLIRKLRVRPVPELHDERVRVARIFVLQRFEPRNRRVAFIQTKRAGLRRHKALPAKNRREARAYHTQNCNHCQRAKRRALCPSTGTTAKRLQAFPRAGTLELVADCEQ